MKKLIYVLAASTALLAGAGLSSCSTTPAEKVSMAQKDVNEANKDVSEANKDLDDANKAYLADIESYRRETAMKIEANDKSVAEFKARVENEKKEAKQNYQRQIADLERKNSDMKKKLDEYKSEGKEKWEKFKTEFNHDMDDLGTAFRGFSVKSSK
jgi:hypothetical protein